MWENCPSVLLVEAFKYCTWKSREKVQLVCRRWGTIVSKDEIPEWKTDFIGGTNARDLIKNVRLADDSICFNTLYPPQIAFIHLLGIKYTYGLRCSSKKSVDVLEMLEMELKLKLPSNCVLICTGSPTTIVSTRNLPKSENPDNLMWNSHVEDDEMNEYGGIGLSITTVFMPNTVFQAFSVANGEINKSFDMYGSEEAPFNDQDAWRRLPMRKYSTPTFEINSFLVWSDRPAPKLVKLLQKWQPDAEIAGGAGAGVHAFNPGSALAFRCPIGSRGRFRFAPNIVLAIGGEGGIIAVSSLGLDPCSDIVKSPGYLPRGSQFIYMDVTNGNDQEVPIVEAIRDFTRDPNLELVDDDDIERMPLYVVTSKDRNVLESFQDPLNRYCPELKGYQIIPLDVLDSTSVMSKDVLWDPDAWSQLYTIHATEAGMELSLGCHIAQEDIVESEARAVGAYMFYPHWSFHYRDPADAIDDFKERFPTTPLIGCEFQEQIGYDDTKHSYASRENATDIAIFWSQQFKRRSFFL